MKLLTYIVFTAWVMMAVSLTLSSKTAVEIEILRHKNCDINLSETLLEPFCNKLYYSFNEDRD